MIRTLSLGLALLAIATVPARADSTANALLQEFTKRGYISGATLGGKDPCRPCTLIGVSRQDANKLVFLSAQKGDYMVTCYPIEGGKWLCASPQKIYGSSAVVP